jgi:hypothetical protein
VIPIDDYFNSYSGTFPADASVVDRTSAKVNLHKADLTNLEMVCAMFESHVRELCSARHLECYPCCGASLSGFS